MTTPNTYTLGTQIRLKATFELDETKTDPTTVTAKVLDPYSTVTTLSPVSDTTGVWYADYTPATSGLWRYRFAGSGAVVAAGEGEFFIAPSPF